jgi:hypothetical protein
MKQIRYYTFSNTSLLSLFLLFCFLISQINSDCVCDEELLILELKQDLEDNGILDCLRIIKPPNGVIETTDQKNKRLAAQWDTSCSFESSADWASQLKKTYGITTLVDEIGEPVDHNLPDQADMCEIIRAIIAGGLLAPSATDVTDVPVEALNYIACPGEENGPKICAVNGSSYYKSDAWTIMLEGMNININNYPKFIKANDNVPKYEVPSDPGQPIDQTELEALARIHSLPEEKLQEERASREDFTKVDKKRPDDPWKRVSVLYSTFTQESIQANTGWKDFDSGNLKISQNRDFYIITYSMVSGANTNKSRLAVRLLLDDVPQISTRMIQGYMDSPAVTTGLISQLLVGTHTFRTQYRVSSVLSFDLDNKEGENLITGMIIIPSGGLFLKKIINPNEFQLYNDNSWTDFPNLSTKVKLSTTAHVLIMYNVAMPGMQSHIVTRVEINTQPVFESRSIAGDSMYWGLHNSIVYKFYADVEYNVKLRFRSPYRNFINLFKTSL